MTVLSVAEHRRGDLRDVTFECLSAARGLADALDTTVTALVVSGDVEGFAEECDREGVDAVMTVDHGEEFNHDVYVQAIAAVAADLDPLAVVAPHSVNGLDYAPAVAAGLGLPLVTDVVSLDADGDRLLAERDMYGSKVRTVVEADLPAVLTIRSGEWPPAEGVGGADVGAAEVSIDEAAVRSKVTGFEEADVGDVDITDADVLVSIGRGIGDEDELELIFDLAEALGATVSASRPIVDAGWLPKNRQVGQSGKTVTPAVYLAIGISGAVQHVAGMKGAGTIVAINTDPGAPIFDVADYGVVGDLFDVVPALIDEFR